MKNPRTINIHGKRIRWIQIKHRLGWQLKPGERWALYRKSYVYR